jgi:hypothetical protein
MRALNLYFAVIYVFLGVVAAFSIHNIWSLQTNPFVSYLGAGRWFYLALDVGAIVASGLTARKLILRARTGPWFVALIAWVVLLTYLGSNLLIYFLLTSTPLLTVLGAKATCISLLAVAALISLRMRVFVDGYGPNLV